MTVAPDHQEADCAGVPPSEPVGDAARLGDDIAELSARIQAATYELLVLIRRFDERDGWAGFRSCAHWLNWRTGLALGAAREKVRVARALGDLPRLSEAMQRGRVSYSKVRAITRVATPENERRLLDFALSGTAAHVERLTRAWRRVDRQAEAADEQRRHARRNLTTRVDDEGMVVIGGRLSPEVGAVVRRALEAAADRLRADVSGEEAAETSFGQRQADALGLLAESALAADLDRGTAGDRYQVVLHVEADTLRSEAGDREPDVSAETPPSAADGDSRASAETPPSAADRESHVSAETRPGVADGESRASAETPPGVAGRKSHVSAETPSAEAPPADVTVGSDVSAETSSRPPGVEGRAEASGSAAAADSPSQGPGQAALEDADGLRVSTETARRMACDAAKVVMRHAADGSVLDVGRRTRTIPPALRRALQARDRQCRFPGCHARRCDVHHIQSWADGGATRLDNLVLLCRRHHRAVHEEGFQVRLGPAGDAEFRWPDGRPFPDAPAAPAWTGPPLAPTDAGLAAADIAIGPDTATPDWYGERLDLDYAIGVMWMPRSGSSADARRAQQ